ncbi:MAG: VWA domain-containing protein [Thermoanaerobaculia bacterium]
MADRRLLRPLPPLGALLLAAGARAQDPSSAVPSGTFGEVVDVRVVNVEVVVTDPDGVPVRGLGPAAFGLQVDGQEIPIEYFTEVQGGVAVDGRQGPTALADVPALVPGEPVGTSYLLFIDELFAIDTDRDEVLQGIAQDLTLLGAADRMAVVAFDGRELQMLSTWSSSPDALARALKDAGRRPAHGMQRLAERRQFERTRVLPPTFQTRRAFDSELDPEAKAYALRLADQVERVVRAASATLRSFARPPGRKVLLLLSGGWPYQPTDFVAGQRIVLFDDLGLVEGEELWARLANTANRLGYTIYPVNLPGAFDRLESDAGLATDSRRQDLYTTLRYLASETGGRAFLGAGRETALRATAADTRSYYWLGFTPERTWDDRAHDIRVTVTNAALEVRSRSGFQDVSRQTEVSMAVESALLFAAFPSSPELTVELGAPRRAGLQKVEVPVTLVLPLSAVTFLPQGSAWVAQLELRFAVADEGFHLAEIPVLPVAVQSATPPAAAEQWRFATTLKLRRRPQELMVAVYDPPSGRILARRVRLDP